MKTNLYTEGLKILRDNITIKKTSEGIKTIGDIDTYRQQHPINGQILSRYKTMVKLYGINSADRMMRELEVRSW